MAGGINLYAYVGGDPVNWIDPEGLAAASSTKYFRDQNGDLCHITRTPYLEGLPVRQEPGFKERGKKQAIANYISWQLLTLLIPGKIIIPDPPFYYWRQPGIYYYTEIWYQRKLICYDECTREETKNLLLSPVFSGDYQEDFTPTGDWERKSIN